jgi:hypothetical protein
MVEAVSSFADRLIMLGRCRSGRRWFWATTEIDGATEHGWEDTQPAALAAAQGAADRMAGSEDVHRCVRHGHAAYRLREINAARRGQRPAPQTADVAPVEYLYGIGHGGDDVPAAVVSFRIIKRTPRRVYYIRDERPGVSGTGYVDRQALEEHGEVRNAGVDWWSPDFRLYTAPPSLDRSGLAAPDLGRLRAAVRDAHPDRGGSNEQFLAAQATYERALARKKLDFPALERCGE